MSGSKPKLSLSCKRRRESTTEEFSSVRSVPEDEFNRNFFTYDENSSLERRAINHLMEDPLDIQQETKSQFPKKKPECSESVSRALHRPCKTPNSIGAWLRKPLTSRSVQCPVCDKVVLLAKINQHLDNNCSDLGVDNKTSMNNCFRKENKANFTQKDLNPFKDQNREREKDYSPIRTVKTSRSCDKLGFERTEDKESNPSRDSSKLSPKRTSCLVTSVKPTRESQESFPHAERMFKSNSSGGEVCVSSIFNEEVCYLKNMVGEKDNYNFHSMCTTEHILSTNEREKQSSFHLNEEERTQSNSKETLEDLNDTETEYEPYYMSNFKLVLNSVFSNEHDKSLFNEEDNKVLDSFTSMSSQEQKLYIRLFQRKRGWFICGKLEYPRISNDLRPIIDHLIQKGFFEDDSHLTSLQDTLNLVAAPDLKSLVKSLHISLKSSGSTKEDIVETIIRQADNQKTIFGSYRSVVLKRAKELLGPCVRVASDPRNVFCRVLLLFTMNVIPDEEDTMNNGQTQQLSTLYLANIGRVVYPSYLIDRPTPVFLARDSLISFSEAYQQKHEMFVALENNNFELAYGYYPAALKKFQEILGHIRAGSETPASLLPEHLRCFTAEWAITKMCYFGVEVLQKWRRYEEAVNQLELLLQQKVFCFDSRGRWYDRLALNLHQHLKKPDKAMEVIRQGLADQHVRFGRHLALVQRAKRILSSPGFKKKGKEKKSDQYQDLDLAEPSQPRSITITGTRCAELGVFIAPEIDHNGKVIDGTTTFCAVEQYALSYYRQQGFDQGMHGERTPFTTLFALFVWDEIFSSGIPDVFRSPFQAAPLDMCFDSFYITRKEIIDKRLQEIKEAPVQKLQDMLTRSWTDHEGQLCAGMNWEQFSTVDQAKQLVACLGGSILSGIFSRFAQGYRYYCAGFPDLVVWNSSSSDYRIAEVKGPGDKLSTKQQIWLDILQSLGANVEVCYVTAVGAKRLKVSH